jgi:hypothetical protein
VVFWAEDLLAICTVFPGVEPQKRGFSKPVLVKKNSGREGRTLTLTHDRRGSSEPYN